MRGPRHWIPFAVYVAVTVVAPAIRGAWRMEGFVEHASTVIVVSFLATVTWRALDGRRAQKR